MNRLIIFIISPCEHRFRDYWSNLKIDRYTEDKIDTKLNHGWLYALWEIADGMAWELNEKDI